MSYFKFQVFASMSQSFDDAAKNKGAGGAELDEVRRMLVETNPWLLAVTALVSVLHMVYVLFVNYACLGLRLRLMLPLIGLKCWLSNRMFHIGGHRKSLLVFPSGSPQYFIGW
jgi:hypothetical protein